MGGICGPAESIEHPLYCTGLGPVPAETAELVEYLVVMTEKAEYAVPGFSVPDYPADIPLDWLSDSSGDELRKEIQECELDFDVETNEGREAATG